MNVKKKNKKASKPPNLNPPNVESVPKKEKKVKESAPKSKVKEEILHPVIRSAVTTIPVSDVKEIENETPKKPKRNKGKNKKQDKEEKIEVQEKTQEVQTESIAKVEEIPQKMSVDEKEFEEKEDALDETNIVPSARKNKNKKKSQEKPTEELITIIGNNSTTVHSEQITEPVENLDTEIHELFSSKSEIPKVEGRKKKNKKKIRTDSERSDKSDNVLLCTSASQNILAEDAFILVQPESKLEQPDSKVEQPDNTVGTKEHICELETVQTESMLACTIESKTEEQIKETVDSEDSTKIPKNESKGKKKNKKDKKEQQTEIFEATKCDLPKEISIPVEDLQTQVILFDESKHLVKESIHIPFESQKQKEPSPKPKAKFAKPAEKQRKGKLESDSLENPLNIESTEIREDRIIDKLSTEPKQKSEKTPNINIVESQAEDQMNKQLSSIPSSIENINVPSEHIMGIKRKKSPKPSKNKTTNIEFDVELEKEKIVFEEKEFTEMSLDLQPEIEVVTSEPIKMPLQSPDFVAEEMFKSQEKPIDDLTQGKSLEIPLSLEIKEDNEGFETKTSKKKKKMPKVPQTESSSEVKESIVQDTKTEDENQIGKETQQISEEQANISLEPCLTVDIEVQSLETGLEASSGDVIPDVHFMRSSSQYILDSNNNTVIQEVINNEEVTLNDPQVIPLIKGSGATPERIPEPVSSGIRMTEIEAKTPTEEKTDIKSKIMEVNQDMEELRLSIERTIAEFTVLEKSDKESENVSESSLKQESYPVKDNKIEAKQSDTNTDFIDKKIFIGQVLSEKTMPEIKTNIPKVKESVTTSLVLLEEIKPAETPPVIPARKDNKAKIKPKKKGKQEITSSVTTTTASESSTSQTKDNGNKETKDKSEKTSKQKTESSEEKGKQQSAAANENDDTETSKDIDNEIHLISSEIIPDTTAQTDFEPIDTFEDALTSSIDDVNKTFEMIAKDADDDNIEFQKKLAANKPEINVTAAEEKDTNRNEKVNPVSQPKNLLGHTDIPVQSNRTDYKKEKNKTPNARQATVKIKDAMDIESKKQSKESQTDIKRSRKASDKSVKECFSRVKNDNEEYVYKYSFRKVFLQSACHVCNRDLSRIRVPCGYCSLVFYCGTKHKDEDWPQHQALCFAVSTLAHMKDQKHIYVDAADTTGQDYRLLRMQMIVSCEKVLKRRLVPWEQEVMLYPRMCADVACREWRQGKLKDCDGCGQLSFCAANPEHLPKVHSRWCKSYSLYQKLVNYQQTKGRLEPRLPAKVMTEENMPSKMNEVLAAMFEEKIDMNDIQYASLTQLATAPLTTAYCLQLYRSSTGITNRILKKRPFTIHVVGAELQFEADALNKWETFFLHLRPDVEELRVVLVSPQLNPGNLPLDLLGRIKLCDNCQQNKRRVIFNFEDNQNYFDYRSSEEFINPDIICAFNPSIQRSSIYNGKDPWPASINTILKLKTPFIITSYTLNELRKDIARIKHVSEIDFKLISEPCFNNFASVRPDRNFISDDEMPLLFKNYCVAVVLGC